MEGHNTWVANQPGTSFFIPVVDLAQHVLAALCYLVAERLRDHATT